MKPFHFILFLIFTVQLFAQDSRIKIIGKIENDSIPIENVHVINLNSSMGAVTNLFGFFQIAVKLHDTLKISEIRYKTKTIIIHKDHIENKIINLILQIKINELEEVIVDKQKNTKGIDATTLNLPNAGKIPLDPLERKLNYYSQASIPIVILATLLGQRGGIDDIYNIISGNRKKHRKLKELLDTDKLKEFRQIEIDKIRLYFNDNFFINTFNLPKEKINLFIHYCLPKGIITYFNDKRYLDVIDIFIKEIDNYNSFISQ